MSKSAVTAAISHAASNAIGEYLKEDTKRKVRDFEKMREEQDFLLATRKNEVDRMMSDFFTQNYRVQPVPEDYNVIRGMLPQVDRTGMTDRSSEALDAYLDSALNRKYIVTKEYQTRHLSETALAETQSFHDEIYNNLKQGETTLMDALDRSSDVTDSLYSYFAEGDVEEIKRKFNDQIYLNYAKSMSYESLADHVKSGFFNDQVSSRSMDSINSLLLRKYRLDHASTTAKSFSIDKALKSISRGEVANEDMLARLYGTYAQDLVVPFRAAKDYMTMTSSELRFARNELNENMRKDLDKGNELNNNDTYKQRIIDDLLIYRYESIKKDPITYGQNAEIIHRTDPAYLGAANLRELEQFVAQRTFDLDKFDRFFGVRSTLLLNKAEREVLVNRFQTTDSAEERLKIVSLFGQRDLNDAFFPGSTAASIVYNNSGHPLISRLIVTNGTFGRKELDANKAPYVNAVLQNIAFATPAIKDSYDALFTAIATERGTMTSDKLVSALSDIGLKFTTTSSKFGRNKKHLSPLKVMNFGSPLPSITPEFLYGNARAITGKPNSALYNGVGESLQDRVLADKDYLIQLYTDDGLNMHPRLIGLYDGTVSDIYLDKDATLPLTIEWR